MFSSTVVRAELVSDLVIPIWVALSTTGIILLSIFQKPSFVTSTYGLEIVIPKGKILDDIHNYYKKLLKQLLSLTINVADPAVFNRILPFSLIFSIFSIILESVGVTVIPL
jgi:hypothetical protein